MKLLVNIDQRSSLMAGIDAPNSTEIIDIPAADIPTHIREALLPLYDVGSGKIDPYVNGRFYDRLEVVAPVTQEAVLQALEAMASAKKEMQAKIEKEKEDRIASDREKVQKWQADCVTAMNADHPFALRYQSLIVALPEPPYAASPADKDVIYSSTRYLELAAECEKRNAARKEEAAVRKQEEECQIREALAASRDTTLLERWIEKVASKREVTAALVAYYIPQANISEPDSYEEAESVLAEHWEVYKAECAKPDQKVTYLLASNDEDSEDYELRVLRITRTLADGWDVVGYIVL